MNLNINRTPHMDQIISKIHRQRKNQTPNEYTMDTYSHPISNKTSNKDLLNNPSLCKSKLNKSCNYHYSQLHQRLQSRTGTDIKKKLLNESTNQQSQVLRGSHSNISTSYLISTLKEKVGKRVQKYNTTEDGSSFTVQDLSAKKQDCLQSIICSSRKLLESSLTIECNLLKDKEKLNLTAFQDLLNRMELKEQPFKITIFADLKKLFTNVALQITSQLNIQKLEVETLCRQNVNLKQQACELSQNLARCRQLIELQSKQLKTKSEETFISIMNTLRSHGVDPRKMLRKHQDNVDTCKLKQPKQPDSSPVDEYSKYSSDDSMPFVDPQTINLPMEKKGLALNLNPLKDPNKAPIGYQDEFMANINEFSESWRQQALAEKRF